MAATFWIMLPIALFVSGRAPDEPLAGWLSGSGYLRARKRKEGITLIGNEKDATAFEESVSPYQ